MADLITEWIRAKEPWRYMYRAMSPPVTIPPNTYDLRAYEVRVDEEGLVMKSVWDFDHPYCGIRIVANELDTGQDITIATLKYGTMVVPNGWIHLVCDEPTRPYYSMMVEVELPFTGIYTVYFVNIDQFYNHQNETFIVLWSKKLRKVEALPT